MTTSSELRAELAVRELEEQLVAEKRRDGAASPETKELLRDARRRHRTLRARVHEED